jgi:tellurite resistance protein
MRDRLEEKKMRQDAEYRNRALALQGAGRQPAISQIAEEIMADPTFKGSKMDAMRAASGLINGVDIRTEATERQKLREAIAKDPTIGILSMQKSQAKTPQEVASIQQKIDSRVREITSIGNAGAGGGGNVDYSQWGAVKKVGP